MAASPFLRVAGAAKTFGAATVLDGVDLDMARGEFVSLLGPSGCGKTTLLRIVSGLMLPDRGTVALDGVDMTRTPPHRRDVSVVFQSYALFPHLTVAENVAFGLKARGVPKAEIAPRVGTYLELVRMGAFADRSIRALSGGQQQRVAVARALVVGPKLILLDEPFSALDRKLRESMQIDLKRLLRDVGTTAVFVTHDQDEALTMSDRIAVMHAGRIEQLDTPAAIYHRPATPFALGFVGLSTQLRGRVASAEGEGVTIETPAGVLSAPGRFLHGSPVLVGIRPERIALGSAGENVIEATLRDVAFQGARVHLHCGTKDGGSILVEAPALPDGAAPGLAITLSWNAADTLVYPDPQVSA